MASTIALPVHPASVSLMPASDTRQVRTYQEGLTYAERPIATNSHGAPLFRFDAVAEVSGQRLGAITVECPTELTDVPLGTIYTPTGQVTLHVSTRKDAYDLTVTLRCDGVEVAE